MLEWLKANFNGIATSLIATGIAVLIGIFHKRLIAFVVRFWTAMRQLKIVVAAKSFDLRFVPLPNECVIQVLPRNGQKPNVQIGTHWRVTNASDSRLVARLLIATLVTPRLGESTPPALARIQVGDINGRSYPTHDVIPPSATRHLSIIFVGYAPSVRPDQPTKIKIVVTDQLSNKYKLPTLRLKPIKVEARSSGPTTGISPP